MKRGQITVFIITGLIILLIIGIVLYITRTEVVREFEEARPRVERLPQEVQPLRDLVNGCMERLANDGLRKIGDSGGYISTAHLAFNPASPTEGDGVQLSPGSDPVIAYWWHMKSDNQCLVDCEFDSERPGLYRDEGGLNIEYQLDEYVTNNLKDCLGDFEPYTERGCTVQELGEPQITTTVAQDDVFFVGKYPLRAVCAGQSFEVEDYYVSIDLNLREIYNLATELTNYESQDRILEQATKTVITTFSEIDSSSLPPPRALEIGPPQPGTFWIKHDVLQKIKGLLASYIPLIQTAGVRNYQYVAAPPGTRDPELYEMLYNRQFFIPLNTSHPKLEAHFMYLDWWEPYFHLNCNGQLCQADSVSNFQLLPFSINRYNFAYDISYPVLVEIRNPDAFNREGYSFKFLLEQNMRNTDTFLAEVSPFKAAKAEAPSIFCAPEQRTSGEVSIYVKDGETLRGMEDAGVSFICGDNLCNLGFTDNGEFSTEFPRCVGGTLRIVKDGYATLSRPLDTQREEPMEIDVVLEPVRTLEATIKNYAITKSSKWGQWEYRAGGLLRPPDAQSATIQLVRNGTPYDEPYAAVVEITDAESAELNLIPGNYTITINSFYKDDITIPTDIRCIKIKELFDEDEKCFAVPQEPILFNETQPFPYGGAEYDFEITSPMLRRATSIEFRQYVIAIDKVPENQRIVEDLDQINKVQLYGTANLDRIYPVIK